MLITAKPRHKDPPWPPSRASLESPRDLLDLQCTPSARYSFAGLGLWPLAFAATSPPNSRLPNRLLCTREMALGPRDEQCRPAYSNAASCALSLEMALFRTVGRALPIPHYLLIATTEVPPPSPSPGPTDKESFRHVFARQVERLAVTVRPNRWSSQ
jgi:hypothetical protein